MKKILFLIFLILGDFISKLFVFNYINYKSYIYLMPILDLVHIHNYGISFGLFSGIISTWIIILVSSLISLLILWMILKSSDMIEKWSLLIVFGGAISNTLDRLINGYVLDFIAFHYQNFYFPAFNFADIYISIGVTLLIFNFLILNKKRK